MISGKRKDYSNFGMLTNVTGIAMTRILFCVNNAVVSIGAINCSEMVGAIPE
jgi:hypothetical protein